jgi:peptide deformylase
MTVLPIYIYPHPVLTTEAEAVDTVTADIQKLMDDMVETMYDARGIGLAAPQVGVLKRVIVLDIEQREDDEKKEKGERGTPMFFINPEIVWESEDINVYNEGCLSIPAQYADIERPKRVKVKYLDYNGQPQEIEADGLMATCLQHEIDHLNGVLFVDHLSKLKRDMIARKLKKWIKENQDEVEAKHVL